MNAWFGFAALVLVVIGLVHSLLGERMIFRCLCQRREAPAPGAAQLRGPHLGILWATWHIATVQAWGMALVLLSAAWTPLPDLVVHSIMVALSACGLLVVAGTRGRHPGGFALLGVSLLVWWAQSPSMH